MGDLPRPITGKRKREETVTTDSDVIIQIVTGSYERALQGVLATIKGPSAEISVTAKVGFRNNFLINAHASSVRCLAVSPPSSNANDQSSKRILATGGADEKINLYQISSSQRGSSSPDLDQIVDYNVELGSLLHHSSTVTSLAFHSRKKLISSSLDNKIAIARVRDWSVLSEIRAPFPSVQGRPSGDTLTPGEGPSGINDVAVHPSAKLCLSVGQGEQSMRLWNLVSGKKAGVLSFDRSLLKAIGCGRWRGGEARSVVWSPDGEEFAVGFDHGVIIYGLDCVTRGLVDLKETKACRIRYVPSADGKQEKASTKEESDSKLTGDTNLLAISTEDGRILFFTTQINQATRRPSDIGQGVPIIEDPKPRSHPYWRCLGSLGTRTLGDRIKDFIVLPSQTRATDLFIVTATSRGIVRVWLLEDTDLTSPQSAETLDVATSSGAKNSADDSVRQVGSLLGSYDTGRRITCLEAFIVDLI